MISCRNRTLEEDRNFDTFETNKITTEILQSSLFNKIYYDISIYMNILNFIRKVL